jgi:predicted nucleic acid-binding protein
VTRTPHLFLDACLLITLGSEDVLDLTTGNPRFRTCAGSRALSEVKRPPAVDTVREALAGGHVRRTAIDLDDPRQAMELARFDAMPAFTGRGDAEALALTSIHDGLVASDDRAVRIAAAREFGVGRLVGTLDLLVWSVRDGRLTVASAETLLARLDVGEGLLAQMDRAGTSLRTLEG